MSTYRDDERAQREVEEARVAKESLLGRVRVASPCNVPWDSMDGTARVRYCELCEKNVYDLSAMTRTEAEDFVARRNGDVCVRFYRRADGTILTSDCPVGVQKHRRRLKVVGAGAATLVTLAGLSNALSNSSVDDRGDRAGECQGVCEPIGAHADDRPRTQAVYK